jgi:hypothetical protein
MSNFNNNEESIVNPEDLNLVGLIQEPTFSDSVLELKSGIYNLFIGLYNNLIIEYGVEEAIKQSTSFLDEISYNFKKISIDYKESNLP